VEIGSFKGKSSCCIAQVAKHLHCVDTFVADFYGGQTGGITTLEEFKRNIEGLPVSYFVGLSVVGAEKIENESIDFIFVDGCHDFYSVKEDIRAWKHKIKEDGIWVFHDYKYVDSYAGLQSVTDAVCSALTKDKPDGIVMSPDGKICYSIAWFNNPKNGKERK